MLEGLLEFILQIVFECIADAIGFGFIKLPGPVLAGLWYSLLGALAAALSLHFWPHHFLHSKGAQVTNLVVSPLASGGLFAALGQWRMRRGKAPSSLEKFANGLLFALSFGVVRFVFAK